MPQAIVLPTPLGTFATIINIAEGDKYLKGWLYTKVERNVEEIIFVVGGLMIRGRKRGQLHIKFMNFIQV